MFPIPLPKALGHALLSTALTAVGLFAPIVVAMPQAYPAHCGPLVESGVPVPVKTVNWFGTNIRYSQYPLRPNYRIDEHLPALKKALLIHFDDDAHVYLWYRGMRVDSGGVPLHSIHATAHSGQAINRGFVVAIHNPPEGFDNEWNDAYEEIDLFGSRAGLDAPTCTAVACRTLGRTGVLPSVPALTTIRTRTLLRHFVRKSAAEKERLGIEFISLAMPPEDLLEGIRWREGAYIRSRVLHLLTGGLL